MKLNTAYYITILMFIASVSFCFNEDYGLGFIFAMISFFFLGISMVIDSINEVKGLLKWLA